MDEQKNEIGLIEELIATLDKQKLKELIEYLKSVTQENK